MLFCLFLQAMGSTLEQYRAAVGLYYYRSRCTTKHLLFRVSLLNLFTYFLLKGLRYYITRLLSKVVQESLFISYILQIIHVLLILSGDVETNPGPEHLHVTQFTLDIFHLNVRSIRNKFDQFLSLVSDYDILCFTESHLDYNIMNDEISIDGFNTIFRKDRNSYGGGVIIYLTDDTPQNQIIQQNRPRPGDLISVFTLRTQEKLHRPSNVCMLRGPQNTSRM